jgi:hypothetical protein
MNKRMLTTVDEPISYYLFNSNGNDEMGNFPVTNYDSKFSHNRYGIGNSAAIFAMTKMEIPIGTINNTFDVTISMWVNLRITTISLPMFFSVYKEGVSDNFLLISF